MAWIDTRARNGKTIYRVRYYDPAGKQRMKCFPRKADATRFKTTIEADLLRGQYVNPRETKTVAEYAYEWIAARTGLHRPATAKHVRSLVDNHIAGTWLGSRRLVDVRHSEVQSWVSDRAQRLAPGTLRNLRGLLASMYADAVLDNLVASSPVTRRIKLPRSERPRIEVLTVEQVTELVNAMAEIRPNCRAMVIAQAGLGLRLGELLALRREDLNWLSRNPSVRVDSQIVSGARERSEPKTPKSRRTIPMTARTANALAAHISAYPTGADGSLFTSRSGLPYRQQHYARVFEAARERAGLPAGTTTHDLRHHYASVLLWKGVTSEEVAERLGHEDVSLVVSTYGHLMPNSGDRTRKALEEAWAGVPEGPEEAESVPDVGPAATG